MIHAAIRRSVPGWVRKVAVLGLLAALAPACDSPLLSPFVSDSVPAFNANTIPHWPLIVLQWNEAMDPTTINGTNIKIFDNITPAPYGAAPTLIHLAGSNQTIVITNTSLISANATPGSGQYAVTTNGLVKSLAGGFSTPLQAEAFFTVIADANASNVPPVFSGPVATAGAATQIDITFTLATDGGPAMSGYYDVYQSTTAGGENLLGAKTAHVASATAATGPTTGKVTMGGLTTGTTYYFIVVAVDTDGNSVPTGEIWAVAP